MDPPSRTDRNVMHEEKTEKEMGTFFICKIKTEGHYSRRGRRDGDAIQIGGQGKRTRLRRGRRDEDPVRTALEEGRDGTGRGTMKTKTFTQTGGLEASASTRWKGEREPSHQGEGWMRAELWFHRSVLIFSIKVDSASSSNTVSQRASLSSLTWNK